MNKNEKTHGRIFAALPTSRISAQNCKSSSRVYTRYTQSNTHTKEFGIIAVFHSKRLKYVV
jgi:hypothetical protein